MGQDTNPKLLIYLYGIGSDLPQYRLNTLPHSTEQEKTLSILSEVNRVLENLEKVNVHKLRPVEAKKHMDRLIYLRVTAIKLNIILQYPTEPANVTELITDEYKRKYIV